MSSQPPERSLFSAGTPEGEQILPINVYDVDHDLVVVVPMPGMEPENVHVTVAGKILTIRASLRGPGQFDRRYIRHEWTYGPYMRRIELPSPVDAERANASLGNGVLTLTLPKVAMAQTRRIELRKTGTAEGHREGHAGHRAIAAGEQGEKAGPGERRAEG